MFSARWFTGFEDLSDAHAIRRRVFIEEQGIAEEDEMDGTDTAAFHLVLYEDSRPAGTGRILLSGGEYALGRIAVLPEFRHRRYGDLIVRLLIRKACEMGGEKQILHAQTQVRGFYEKLGFIADGGEFMEAGIPHITMAHIGDIGGKTAEK